MFSHKNVTFVGAEFSLFFCVKSGTVRLPWSAGAAFWVYLVTQQGSGVDRPTAGTGLVRGSWGGRGSLIGWEQALPLGVLQDGVVAEVVLVRGLDAEGPLRSHAPHCLAHVQGAHVLQLGQTDVQRAEGPCRG